MTAVVGLLSWWDENEAFLDRAIRSAAAAGVSALVALDGPYALFETAGVSSGARQAKTIRRACRAAGIPLVLEQPSERWPTEMAKRTRLFQLGETITTPDDWYVVLDADYEIAASAPLADLLADLAEDAATVRIETPTGPSGRASFGPAPVMEIRALFRASRGLHVDGNHYSYFTADGRLLWGNPTRQHLEPAHDLTGEVTINHWTYFRSASRLDRQFGYYQARDQAGVELRPCMVCETELSQVMVPTGLRREDDESVTAGWVEVCHTCKTDAIEAVLAEADALGIQVGVDGLPRVPLAAAA